MSPLELNIILHYHVSPVDYSNEHEINTAQQDALSMLVASRMLIYNPALHPEYLPTDKLHYYCEYLCATPLPQSIYIIEREDDE